MSNELVNKVVLRPIPQRGMGEEINAATETLGGVLMLQGANKATAVAIARNQIDGPATAVIKAEGRGKGPFGPPPTAQIRVGETPSGQPVIRAAATGRVAIVQEAHAPNAWGMKELLRGPVSEALKQVSKRGTVLQEKVTRVDLGGAVNEVIDGLVDGTGRNARPTPSINPPGSFETHTEYRVGPVRVGSETFTHIQGPDQPINWSEARALSIARQTGGAVTTYSRGFGPWKKVVHKDAWGNTYED